MPKYIANFSKEHAEGHNSGKFKLPYSIAMDVSEWSVSGSGIFYPDVSFTEVLRSLEVTALLIINY
jgi:hypothetical protein